ncbi:hypothetical protein MBRA1_002884 [Malassezia brasiliensis]|uniref:Zinc finger CHCC-type domain-containing protein n=1 Tax=Malassezia brasiliensis TaxID=1821822 RepID=A0AAF0ITT3_9BASI|nr:hypothetical protein MBRA1_002884 [Malassezia brasiliensis]
MFVRAVATPLRSVRRAPTALMGVRMKSNVATQATTTVATEHDERSKLRGDFVRPQVDGDYLVSGKETRIAEPQTPPEVSEYGVSQAPNYAKTWSEDQRSKAEAMKGPRFEQIAMEFQPSPMSAMELISNVPVQFTTKRVVSCDGGDGPLGHPRVYINLDKPGPKGCPYCGLRFQKHDEHAHYVP